jgi:hypothetical protein
MAFKVSGTPIINDTRGFISYSEVVNARGNTGAAQTIDLTLGNFITATLNSNCTFTFSNPLIDAFSFTLVLTNDATANRTITWPASVVWPGGTVPNRTTAANKTDVYTFFTTSGITTDNSTTWYGNIGQYNY